MDTKLLLIASVIISFMLLGCTSASQQQPPPSQNTAAIDARTGANTVNATPLPPQQKQYTCALTLNPSTINAGSSTEVGFSVQSAQNVAFTYSCGNETRDISTGGLTSGSRLCQFGAPGSVEVWIKADGAICAQETLTVVQPQSAKTCYINQSSVSRDLAGHHYAARVQFTGFSPQDKLVWICDRTTATHTLGGDGTYGMPLYSDIYCDFPGVPQMDSIDVSIGNVSCGSISTR